MKFKPDKTRLKQKNADNAERSFILNITIIHVYILKTLKYTNLITCVYYFCRSGDAVRAFTLQSENWVFESEPRQT